MPNLYEDEENLPAPPAPNVPPVVPAPPGGLGPGGPPIGVPVQGPEAPAPQVGGQGGGPAPAPWALPGLPGLNIPGAPKFNAPVYVAPTKDSLFSDPGYQGRVDAGSRALERSAAAKGMLRGGNTLTGLSEWNQNLAAQEYQNMVNRSQAQYQNDYRRAYDMFAPEMARWQVQAGGLRDLTRDRFQAELNHALDIGRPNQGGGGGQPDLSWLTELPMPPINPGGIPGGGMPPPGMPGGGPAPHNPESQMYGDPWTENYF